DSKINLNKNKQSRKTLKSYTNPSTASYGNSICIPSIKISNFKLNPQLIIIMQQNCQYSNLPQKKPTEFLTQFLQITDTVHNKKINQNIYIILLFPFTVKNQTKK
ncbi:hypothetical protein DF186_14420, partial [Enterococcus hirae]